MAKNKVAAAPTAEVQQDNQVTEEILANEPVIQPSSITPAADPGRKSTVDVKLQFGEVLVVQVDDNGNEIGAAFKTSAATFNKHYAGNTNFLLKKTFQP